MENYFINKKNHTAEPFSDEKLLTALNKTAVRVMYRKFNHIESEVLLDNIKSLIRDNINVSEDGNVYIDVDSMHAIVESSLDKIPVFGPRLKESYMNFRNWKSDYAHKLEDVKEKIDSLNFRGDKSNANTNSSYVSTKRCIGYNILNKELYQMNFMNPDELQACKE